MKFPLSAVVACIAATVVAGPAFALDFPSRKPGLWEIQTQTGEAAGGKGAAAGTGGAHTMQQCIDASTDKALRDMGQSMGKDLCSKQELRTDGGKLVMDSVCKIGNTVATSHAVISGDFSSAYRMESKSTYDPPLMGRAEGTSAMEARWIGPCKADQKPGDMVMPNGMKMNVLDMMKNRPKRP
ncbi:MULTISPECIES: DUF3617 family protein [unclassified Variovorax]|jgi:hypothetical protein|uniref:DUF3617 domain-containing protein n=1 Tax=unclassified Variovorax TaxID=663243 RepID=UPI000F7DF8B2|nr:MULTISPECIES: DUF3617 family protein [unclassified Variovorax]RSZ32732.1 DUF3617 family protein [Variovorax sp. 553]RSZ33031.1 DUF3617 family protein [Variovorax sp. 679]